MPRYSRTIREKVRYYRSLGKTYSEIREALDLYIPKSTLSLWSRGIVLPKSYREKVYRLGIHSLENARRVAVEINKIKRDKFFQAIAKKNAPIAGTIHNNNVGKIALAMLCLGEASKYNSVKSRSFNLGNSDIRIINIFLALLKVCFQFSIEKVRATVQCRADQDPIILQQYWAQNTGIPNRLFYKPQIDPRTKGKPTLKKDYHGVLRIDYFDTKVQLELECLADLVYNELRSNRDKLGS
jgi:hypothetical protein